MNSVRSFLNIFISSADQCPTISCTCITRSCIRNFALLLYQSSMWMAHSVLLIYRAFFQDRPVVAIREDQWSVMVSPLHLLQSIIPINLYTVAFYSVFWKGKQTGIVSYGFGCDAGFPDVYTDVYFYSSWIEENRCSQVHLFNVLKYLCLSLLIRMLC